MDKGGTDGRGTGQVEQRLYERFVFITGFRNILVASTVHITKYQIRDYIDKYNEDFGIKDIVTKYGYVYDRLSSTNNEDVIAAIGRYETDFIRLYGLEAAKVHGYEDMSEQVNVVGASGWFRGTRLEYLEHERLSRAGYIQAVRENTKQGIAAAVGAAHGGEHALEISTMGAAADNIIGVAAHTYTGYATSRPSGGAGKGAGGGGKGDKRTSTKATGAKAKDVKQLEPGANLTQEDLIHIFQRHEFGTPSKSFWGFEKSSGKFAEGTTINDLKRMIDQAYSGGKPFKLGQNITKDGYNLIYEFNFGRIIGTTSGKDTSWMRLIVDKAGVVKSAYPIPNKKK